MDSPALPVPAGVEVCRRTAPDHDVFVLLNFSPRTAGITLPQAMSDVLHGGEVRQLELPRYGVALLTRPRPAPSP